MLSAEIIIKFSERQLNYIARSLIQDIQLPENLNERLTNKQRTEQQQTTQTKQHKQQRHNFGRAKAKQKSKSP